MIKNIIFDMGGVLVHYNPSELVSHFDISPEDRELLLKEVFGSVAWIRLDRGSISSEDALTEIKSNLPERLHNMANQLVNGWWELELRPMEDMEPLLAELKQLGYGIYLLSNATVRQPEYFDRIPGSQYFDGKIISAYYKLLKPQHEIFEKLLQVYALNAEECFFVDDLNINIEGAYCAGISGTVFDGSAEHLRAALNRAGVPVKAG